MQPFKHFFILKYFNQYLILKFHLISINLNYLENVIFDFHNN